MGVVMVRQKVKDGSVEAAEAAARELFATLDRVRPQGLRYASTRVVDATERDARVGALQHHRIARLVEPKAEPVALAMQARHLGHPMLGHDLTREERAPERAHICGSGVDPTIAAASHGQMQHVRPRAVGGQIPARRSAR